LSYYTGKVSNVRLSDTGGYTLITADVEAGYGIVQVYVAGLLIGTASVVAEKVSYTTNLIGPIDPVSLLAVDGSDADIDYWSVAFPEAESAGNRISVSMTATEGMKVGWKWRVSVDGVIEHEADIFPNSQGAGGWGIKWGENWGHGPFGAGWGYDWGTNWGHGGGIVLSWFSEPLVIGTYAVTVSTIDRAGNVSTAASSNVTIATYPRPPADLTVSSYVLGTDTLTLSWTASEDIA